MRFKLKRERHQCCTYGALCVTETVRAMTHVINQGMAMYWGTSRWSPMEIMVRVHTKHTHMHTYTYAISDGMCLWYCGLVIFVLRDELHFLWCSQSIASCFHPKGQVMLQHTMRACACACACVCVLLQEAYSVARQFNQIPPICEQAEYHMFQREKVEVQLPELFHKIGESGDSTQTEHCVDV